MKMMMMRMNHSGRMKMEMFHFTFAPLRSVMEPAGFPGRSHFFSMSNRSMDVPVTFRGSSDLNSTFLVRVVQDHLRNIEWNSQDFFLSCCSVSRKTLLNLWRKNWSDSRRLWIHSALGGHTSNSGDESGNELRRKENFPNLMPNKPKSWKLKCINV